MIQVGPVLRNSVQDAYPFLREVRHVSRSKLLFRSQPSAFSRLLDHSSSKQWTQGYRGGRSGEAAENASYNIPPVQLWDPRTDTFSPYFPIGWYSFGPSARIEEIAENGANTALYAGMGLHGWQLGDTLKRMDVAQELGVKIVVGLHAGVIGGVQVGKPSTYGVIPDYVEAFNKHPAMLGWQLGDEFSASAAPQINDTVKLLRQLGSKHQTWQVHPHTWGHEEVKKLMACTDVCNYDGYTYIDGQPEFENTASARVLAWQQAKADLIQTEGWSGNVTQAVGCQCGDAAFRFPTADEYRRNVFSTIATTGARGTMNWIYSYWGGFYADDPNRFFAFRDETVKPVNLEQRRIAHAMEHGYKVGRILLRDPDTRKYFLIVTNNEGRTRDLQLTLSALPAPLSSLSIHEPRRKRTLRLADEGSGSYAFRDHLPGYAVAIYVLA